MQDAERVLEQVRAAGHDAAARRAREQRAISDTLGGVVRVADGAVRTAGPNGIDSAELCQLEDMIFDATAAAARAGAMGASTGGDGGDNSDGDGGASDVAEHLEKLHAVRRGIQAALRQREEHVHSAQHERVRGVEDEAAFLRESLTRANENAAAAATAARDDREQRARDRLQRFVDLCDPDKIEEGLKSKDATEDTNSDGKQGRTYAQGSAQLQPHMAEVRCFVATWRGCTFAPSPATCAPRSI